VLDQAGLLDQEVLLVLDDLLQLDDIWVPSHIHVGADDRFLGRLTNRGCLLRRLHLTDLACQLLLR